MQIKLSTSEMKELSLYSKDERGRDKDVIRNLWLFKQEQGINHQIPDINQIFSLMSIDETKECVDAILEILNNVPPIGGKGDIFR